MASRPEITLLMSNHGKAHHLCITPHLFVGCAKDPTLHFCIIYDLCAAGLRTAAAVACAEGVGAEDAASTEVRTYHFTATGHIDRGAYRCTEAISHLIYMPPRSDSV